MMKLVLTLFVAAVLCLPLAAQKRAITLPETAAPTGATPLFSPGIVVDGTLYVSGQIGADLKTRKIPADFDAEVKTALDNVGAILKAADMNFNDVVAVQVYLTDMSQFARMNAVYTTYFNLPRPARTTVGVTKLALPDAHIEITVTAHKSGLSLMK